MTALAAARQGQNPLDCKARKGEPMQTIYPLTHDEMNRLIANAKRHTPTLGTMLQVVSETGIRQSELYDLTWADLDPVAQTLRITSTKTRGSRILPISSSMVRELLALQSRVSGHSDRIFPGRPSDLLRARRGLCRACDSSGLPRLRWTELRAKFLSDLVNHGADCRTVMQLGGYRFRRL